MPHGLPSATVIEAGEVCFSEDQQTTRLLARGTKVEPLHVGADQDGWLGEIICRVDGSAWAIPRRCLRLR